MTEFGQWERRYLPAMRRLAAALCSASQAEAIVDKSRTDARKIRPRDDAAAARVLGVVADRALPGWRRGEWLLEIVDSDPAISPADGLPVHVREAVNRLLPRQRLATVLVHYVDLPVGVVVALLDCSAETLAAYVSDARQALVTRFGNGPEVDDLVRRDAAQWRSTVDKSVGSGRLDFPESTRWGRASTKLIAAAVIGLVVGATLLGRSVLSRAGDRAAGPPDASSAHRSAPPVPGGSHVPLSYATAELKHLGALSGSDAAGRIALPWTLLRAAGAGKGVEIAFASRSCERVDGVYISQSGTSVTINVLASNIVGIPSCDVVPELYRGIIHLAAPLSSRALLHAPIDKTDWPTNPFDGH